MKMQEKMMRANDKGKEGMERNMEGKGKRRKRKGNNIYGCSVCIKVCPKNKNNLYCKDDELKYEDFINNSQKTFKEKYKDTGFCWRGNSVIKRNALIGFENSLK